MTASPFAIATPIDITDAMLISTNITEADYTAWSSGGTYAVGDRVILTSTHRIYESLQASNTNHAPESSPLWWVDVSPTNRWKAFDTKNSSLTLGAGTPPQITYTLRPGQAFNYVAILNIANGTAVSVKMTDPVYGVVYEVTDEIRRLPVKSSWYGWFFGPFFRRSQSKHKVPVYPNSDIEITIDGETGLGAGIIMVANALDFSSFMRTGARTGIQDYSRKKKNDYGDVDFVELPNANRGSFSVLIKNNQLDYVQRALAAITSKPSLFIASDLFESTSIFGFFTSFEVLISYPTHSEVSIDIEGLI